MTEKEYHKAQIEINKKQEVLKQEAIRFKHNENKREEDINRKFQKDLL